MNHPDRTFAELRISRSTTAEQVAAALRERIITGEFAPGLPLREVPIAESIGVSRNTVREAFRLLSAEGLVRHSMHRGITVSKLVRSDVIDIYEARRTLELSAIPHATGEKLRDIEIAIEALAAAIRADDRKMTAEADFSFHTALVRAIGSARLAEFHASLLTEVRLALAIADYKREEGRVFAEDHIAILDALRQANFGVAARILKTHLDASERIALSIVDEQDEAERREMSAGS
ncbi:MAG: GntR family transcriptional regulator [Dongiaceae bacterium]